MAQPPPSPQSDSTPMSPPVPGESGMQWEVDKWGDRRAHATPAGWLLSATSVPPPWPALGMPHHLPRPQEPLCGARPRGLYRLGGVGTGWAMRTPAASLVRDPQGQERGLGDRLDPEQQWGLSLPGLVSHHLGGHSLVPGVPPCQPFWSQAGLGGQGLSRSGTALLGAARTVGARGPGLEAAGSALSQGREQGM